MQPDGATASRPDSGPAPAPQSSSTEDLRLWVRLLDCAKLIEKRLRRRFADEFDTTLPRFDVLAALDRAGTPLSMSALSQALLVSGGNVTHVVRQLQADGLVATAPSPDDARSALVSLTGAGKARFAELAAAHSRWVAQSIGAMPAESRTALAMLLGELRGQLGR